MCERLDKQSLVWIKGIRGHGYYMGFVIAVRGCIMYQRGINEVTGIGEVSLSARAVTFEEVRIGLLNKQTRAWRNRKVKRLIRVFYLFLFIYFF
jgi:hypothetical protein